MGGGGAVMSVRSVLGWTAGCAPWTVGTRGEDGTVLCGRECGVGMHAWHAGMMP